MLRQRTWPIHFILIVCCAVMLTPFYWVLKTSITGENLFTYPPSIIPVDPQPFYYVQAWYSVPFAQYFFNSVSVALIAIIANLFIDAAAGYALTKNFRTKRTILLLLLACLMIPFQATIIPAYLITRDLGLLNSLFGLALPQASHIICIFVFKASFEAIPISLIEAAKVDGVPERDIFLKIILPLAKPAIATTVILSFIWAWNDFLWPLIAIRDQSVQTLPLGLVRFRTYFEDTSGALYAFVVMILAPGLYVFFLAQNQFIQGLTSGARKG